jgi:hypothetical protein
LAGATDGGDDATDGDGGATDGGAAPVSKATAIPATSIT